jgi:hypothetical protein
VSPSDNGIYRSSVIDRALDHDAIHSDRQATKIDGAYQSDSLLSMPRN